MFCNFAENIIGTQVKTEAKICKKLNQGRITRREKLRISSSSVSDQYQYIAFLT